MTLSLKKKKPSLILRAKGKLSLWNDEMLYKTERVPRKKIKKHSTTLYCFNGFGFNYPLFLSPLY